MKLEHLKQNARGHWHTIHRQLGIPQDYLNPHKHCPCPSCGGKDRYRYTNHKDNGGYICNQCGAGSGFDLLMLVHRYDFNQAVNDVANALGCNPTTRPQIPKPPIQPPPDKRPQLQSLWESAHPINSQPSHPINNYLINRGITPHSAPNSLRYHPKLTYWHKGKPLHHAPAMIARIDTPQEQLQGLHITYLQSHYPRDYGEDGLHQPQLEKLTLTHQEEPLPAKKMRTRYTGAIKGAGVYLHPYSDILGVTEGIETALAAHELFGLPTCATLSAHGMQHIIIPARVKTLVIIGDSDYTGQKAQQALKIKALRQGLNVQTWHPPIPESDALDYLNIKKGKNP